MIPLDELITAMEADVLARGSRHIFDGFAHDSRIVSPGECFVAVRGLRGDGHDYVAEAADQGASAVVIARARRASIEAREPGLFERLERLGVSVLAVDDTRAALKRYAAHMLHLWRPIVIAVTGGVGKTTTKEAIADVLSVQAPTFRSWRNYNDLLGLPLSLGRLEPAHRYAVLELGADHPGEIAELCAMIRPQVGVVTNDALTQMQYFDDLDHYYAELAGLPAALPADGYAVLNGDPTQRTYKMAEKTAAQVRMFCPFDDYEHSAAYRASHPLAVRYRIIAPDVSDDLNVPYLVLAHEDDETQQVAFPNLLGGYWAEVVLAALTVGVTLGVDERAALERLQALRPLPGRMRKLVGVDGLTLLDDSHNATVASVAQGLLTLERYAACHKPRLPQIVVLGDILRLGAYEQTAYNEIGRSVAKWASFLVTRGSGAEAIAKSAIAHGMSPESVAITHTAEDAAQAVREVVAEKKTETGETAVVYIKGSEEMRMEQVTALLMAHPEEAATELDRQTQSWRRVVVMRPDRPTWLEIDLSAIGANTRQIKSLVGQDVTVLVSMKADAYGHGALRVARTVLNNGAGWLGVATLSEAQPLRAAGVSAPILVFGYLPPWQARDAVRLDLRATIYELASARALAEAAREQGTQARVHVKIDTGMARLGIRWEDIPAIVSFFREVHTLDGLLVEGVFTHFATADSADQTYARRQLDRFHQVLAALDAAGLRPPITHAANSAATLTLPEARFDLVRPGIAIYGLAPSDDVPLPDGFRPALSFKTQVAQVKEIPAGEGISYGATYVTREPTRIAVLPVGYADGFRRGPANWGEVLVRGRRAPLLGRVCMDQCMIDVTHIPDVRAGDEVVLIGRQGDDELTAEAVAERLGTIAYEVVAELLARVPRLS